MMNNYIKTVLLILAILGNLSISNAIDINNNSVLTTQCDEANVNVNYYIPNDRDSIKIYPLDTISNADVPIFIRNTETKVSLFQNTNGTMNCGDWWRVSKAIPAISGSYMAIGSNGCTLNKVKKSNTNKPSSQITYKIAYKRQEGFKSGTSNYFYYKEGDNTQYTFSDQRKRKWSGVKYTGNECFNINVNFCGDGVLNSSNGEQCDDGNNTDGDGCSATCEEEITPSCEGLTVNETSGAYVCTGNSTTTSYRLFQNNVQVSTNNTGSFDITNPGDYVFECRVNGETTTKNSCKKTLKVTEPKFDLSITKEIISEAPYKVGDIIEYKIVVTNQGDIDATNVEVIDYIPSQMEFVSSTGWSTPNSDGETINKTITSLAKKSSKSLYLKLKIKSGLSDGTKVKNWAEIFKASNAEGIEDCDSTPESEENNNHSDPEDTDYSENKPNPDGCNKNEDDGDEDDIDPAELEVGGKFDLALRKTTITEGPYNIGDVVKYKIEVFNQGTLKATDVEVTDYIPNEMELVSGKVKTIISEILPGKSKPIYIELKIKGGIADGSSIKNYAEILEDNATDCDSEADDTNGNQDGEKDENIDDNEIGSKCDSTTDEDDHDIEEIFIGNVCISRVTGTQNSAINENTSGLCKISGQAVGDFVTNTNGRTSVYTWTCNTSTTKYTGGNCSANYTRGRGSSGSSAVCLDIIDKGSNKYTCIGDKDTKMIGIDCDGDGKYEQVKYSSNRSAFTKVNGTYSYTFTCNTVDSEGNSTVNNPRCAVEKHNINANQTSGWNTSTACKNTTGQTCGNGKIEGNEECEKTDTNHDGKIDGNDTLPNYCSSTTCRLKGTGGSTTPGAEGNLFTTPNEGKFTFEGGYDVVMGGNKTLDTTGKLSSIKVINDTDYTFGEGVITGVCIAKDRINKTKDINDETLPSLDYTYSKTKICTPLSGKYYTGQEIILNENVLKEFKSKLGFNGDFSDNNMVVTISTNKDMGSYSDILNWSEHMSDKFKVRVAKPAAQTTSGTRYTTSTKSNVNTQAVATNINTVVDYSETSDNDVGVGTSSSSSNTTTDTNVVTDATDYNNNSNIIDTSNSTSTFEKYNGLENVFIKSGDTAISTIDYDNITEPTTYIIEGDLTIDDNVIPTHNHNIAFVVKNGDIIIDNGVENIKGTYIVLGSGGLKSDGIKTDNVLTVKGSLYGNTDDLISHRIKVSETDGQLSFGTVVSFGSSIFQKPAPMVTSFVNDYLSSDRVAK